MAGGMEVDPAAIQGFATFLADAKSQLEKVTARFDAPAANGKDFGRHWASDGEQYVNSYGKLGPDLASLSTLLDQVAAQLTAGAKLTVAGETTTMGEFTKIEAGGDAPSNETGGI